MTVGNASPWGFHGIAVFRNTATISRGINNDNLEPEYGGFLYERYSGSGQSNGSQPEIISSVPGDSVFRHRSSNYEDTSFRTLSLEAERTTYQAILNNMHRRTKSNGDKGNRPTPANLHTEGERARAPRRYEGSRVGVSSCWLSCLG